jgi:hypothetical protein
MGRSTEQPTSFAAMAPKLRQDLYNIPPCSFEDQTAEFQVCIVGKSGRKQTRPAQEMLPYGAPLHNYGQHPQLTRPMHKARIERLHKELQYCLWQLDVVLKHTIADELFSQMFKDTTYVTSVFFLLNKTRDFLWRFLVRERVTDRRMHARFVEGTIEADDDGAALTESPPQNDEVHKGTIYLPPDVWTQISGLESFFFLRFEADEYDRMDQISDSLTGILLHECIHLVSSFWFPKFIGKGTSIGLVRRLLAGNYAVQDVQIGEAVHREHPDDKEILEQVLAETIDDTAYCPRRCRALASLKHGAIAALLNADSFNTFVQLASFQYLGHLLRPMKDPKLKPADADFALFFTEHPHDEYFERVIADRYWLYVIPELLDCLPDSTREIYNDKIAALRELVKPEPPRLSPRTIQS